MAGLPTNAPFSWGLSLPALKNSKSFSSDSGIFCFIRITMFSQHPHSACKHWSVASAGPWPHLPNWNGQASKTSAVILFSNSTQGVFACLVAARRKGSGELSGSCRISMTLFVSDFGRGKRDPSDASSPGLASQAFERAAHTKSMGQPSGGWPHLSELGGGVKGLPAAARHGKQAAFHHTLQFSTRHSSC